MPRTTKKNSVIRGFAVRPKPKVEKPSLKERSETLNTMASLVYKVAAAIGAGIVFIYLFEIGFFPTGLTAAEVVFFIFVALGFGLVYPILLGFGAGAAIWLFQLMVWLRDCQVFPRRRGTAGWTGGRIPGNRVARWMHRVRFRSTRFARRGFHPRYAELRGRAYTLISLPLCAVFASLTILVGPGSVKRLMIGLFVGGLVALTLSDSGRRKRSGRSAKNRYWTSPWSRLLLALVLPLALLGSLHSGMEIVHLVFQQLGIRILNVSVEVPASELDSMERISDALNRPLLDCHRSGKEDRLLIHHANVLWTGIGSVTDLSFEVGHPASAGWFAPDPKPSQQATLRLDTSSLRILDARPPLNPCFDLPNDMLFGTAEYDLTPEAQARLKALVSQIQDDGRVAKIVVRGHSDARRIDGKMARDVGDNQRLSERRAQAVADALGKLLAMPDVSIAAEGAGSREPKVNCPVGLATTPYEAQQCNAPNRRVEIRVTYAPGSAQPAAQAPRVSP
ncbi:OmpA family protein [Trinickia sp. NRRL B-1857]|uniref:OmpA family protein n=1 Tax=Trinickia sp. NRRL B-1857 TaxID=3162879 RepID=UPI003D27A96B